MLRGDLSADGDQIVRGDAEFGEPALRLDVRLGEMAALGLGEIVHLDAARSQLDGGISVLVLGLVSDDLALIELQHGHGNMLPFIGEEPRHSQLLCDDT